jgi:dihydrodipicolinate reductase
MDIAILGASGRVGKILIQEVLGSSEDQLVACYVSSNSEYIGRGVDGTDLQYEAPTLNDVERTQIIQHTVDRAAGKAFVLAGTGANDTTKAVA